jgi:DNA-binding MarR family transcriptional regulator
MKASLTNKSALQEEVISLIYSVAKQMHKTVDPGDRDELSQGQLSAMVLLSHQPCNTGVLASKLDVTLPTVTALADRLVGHGWVERKADPGDRRVVRLELTSEGEAVLERARQARIRRLSFMLDAMPDEDVATLHRIFSDLSKTLDKSKPQKVVA